MDNTFVWTAVASVAVAASAGNLIPQVVRSWRTKKTEDLSRLAIIVIMIGNIAWIAHGVHNGDRPLILANSVLLVSALTLLTLKILYDRRVSRNPSS